MIKRILSVLLCAIIVCALLSACGENAQTHRFRIDPEQVSKVTATDSLTSSYLYIIEDGDAVAQLCELVNALTYRELNSGEEAPDNLLIDKLYGLTFQYDENDSAASCYISPDGYFLLDDFDHPYVLTSKFDEGRLKKLLEEYNTFK